MRSLKALFLFLLLPSAVMAPPSSAQQSSLQLTVQTERPVVELGEPVYVTVRITNDDSKPISFRPMLDPRDGEMSISVRNPTGDGVGYIPLAVRDSSVAATPLAPKAQVAKTVPIFFGSTGWVFKEPGRYSVRASFESYGAEGQRVQLLSAPIAIEVKEGSASLRNLMTGSEASLQAGRFLEWRSGDQLTEGRALLERISIENPQTPLVSHYRLAEARSWARPFKDYRAGNVRSADPQRALAELERVRDDVLPQALIIEKRITQANALIATNRQKEATELIARISAALSARPELAHFREQVQRLEAAARLVPAR